MADLRAQPLTADGQFNWVFLIEVLFTGILSLFFLFYFNRLFATLVSYAIRAYTWRTYKAYIDISALQISLLGGRIFFKSIRYHAHNVTVYVYEGHITWRYWLRSVQEAEVFNDEDVAQPGKQRTSSSSGSGKESSDDPDEKSRARTRSVGKEEQAGMQSKKELPCRIAVKVAGVEAFIYNRSPMYDGIVEATLGKSKDVFGDEGGRDKNEKGTPSSPNSSGSECNAAIEKTATRTTTASASPPEKAEVPSFLRVFPIKVECKRAAAAVGNENTTNVLVAKAEKALGTVDAGHAGPLDLWKLLFNFSIENVDVTMKPNRDFKEFQLEAARRILREQGLEVAHNPEAPIVKVALDAQGFWMKLCRLFKRSKGSADSIRTASLQSDDDKAGKPLLDQLSGTSQWHGLMRYLDDNDDEHDEWRNVEYAKASQLVECDKVTMRFYWDMSGPVPEGVSDGGHSFDSKHDDDINGSAPPEYGMDLGVYGGFVVYGPWADRQRLNLQSVFFPAPCVDAVPARPLKPGELRVCTVFKIAVIVEADVVLRIPCREESKDSRWKGRAENAAKPPDSEEANASKGEGRRWGRHGKRRKGKKGTTAVDARPYAWLDITLKKDSVVNYVMDMFARPAGYRNSLDLDVKGLEMSSSVNHGLLWRSGPLTLDADISQPVGWNTLRKWPFNIVVNDLELFILRDHLFLIIDLVNDWASGAPSDFYTFVPYNYQINLVFNNFIMYLNVNDANIINDPADFDRNDFITLEGQVSANLGIPMENYRPKRNGITFDVLGEGMRMRMMSPQKSTFSAFVQDKTMAELPRFTLKGSHNANQEALVGNVDVLRMDIVGTGLSLKAYGFFVRQLVSLKENYFGDYMHFKTLEEFQGASEDLEEANAKTASFPKPISTNELDVILCIVAEQATIMFPTTLYSCNEFVRVELPRADVDLRIASYYLDLGLQLSPLSFLSGASAPDDDDDDLVKASNTQFYVAHVDLNGHRAFGLPPNEDAYVSQWDIDIGKVSGEMSSVFVRDLALAGRAFGFCIGDDENALPVTSPAVALDAGFVQVRTDTVRLWLHVGKDALLFATEPITVETSDWASETLSQRVTVLVPQITVACVDGRSASRHRVGKHRKRPVKTHAFFQTGLSLDVVGRKLHFDLETRKQQSHFRLHDQRTNRFPFLLRSAVDAPIAEEDNLPFEPPAMPFPPMPPPLTKPGSDRPTSIKSARSLGSGKRLASKSSTSSLAASLRHSLGMANKRPDLLSRATERSTGGTSASFHSIRASSRSSSHSRSPLPSDADRGRLGLPSSTVAFASSYSEPYFPLETIEPDETDVPRFLSASESDSERPDASSTMAVISNPAYDNECEHSSVMIKMVPGIRAHVVPRVAITASKLMRELLPRSPDEVMDAFQMGAMGTIQGQHAERHGVRRILEIQAELPAAHLRVSIFSDKEEAVTDQLDLTLDSLATSVRIRTQPADAGATQCLAFHTLLAGLDLTLTNRQAATVMPPPAIHLSADDALVWLALASTDAFHVSTRSSSLAVAGNQAKYLTSLALQMVPIISDLKWRFEGIFDLNLRRLQLLVHVLTRNGEHKSDPAFMARMVYILRAFPLHFRNTDSWKILARYRFGLQSLPSDVRTKLEKDLKALSTTQSEAPSTKALETWTQWRNWDVPNVSQTSAFQMLCSPNEARNLEVPEAKPTTITFRSEMIKVGVEHSKGNSDILLEDLSLGVENSPPTKPEGLMLVDENKRTKTLLQIHTSTIAFGLDWALVSVAEDVLSSLSSQGQIRELSAAMEPSTSRTASQAFEDGLSRHDVQAVLSTDTGSISLQTTNLRHVSRADGLKLSLIATTRANDQYGQCASAIIHCDTAVTELHGPSSRIWQTLTSSPSLYLDHLQAATGVDMPPTITLAMAYEDFQIVVNEQIPGILHTIETVVAEEVAQIQRLVLSLSPSPSPAAPTARPQTPTKRSASEVTTASSTPKLHIGLLAGNLRFEISLLQALSYQLEGTAAGFRLAPSLSHDNQFSIDFDVGRQNHAFINSSGNERHTQGILDFPPVNGCVGLQLADDRTSISVATTVEKIEVDAGALQGIIGVINQPEVESVISAIKSGVEDVQAQIAELYPADAELRRQKKATYHETAFDIRFALLGVRVAAVTPGNMGRSTARVEFGIGPVHANASNRGPDMRAKSLIPEVRAHIQDIGASLRVRERAKTRSCGNATLSIGLHFASKAGQNGLLTRELNVRSDAVDLNAYPETASTIVDVINHLQDRIKHLDLSKEVEYLRRLRDKRKGTVMRKIKKKQEEGLAETQDVPFRSEDLLSIKTNIRLNDIRACWIVDPSFAPIPQSEVDDLILSIERVQFSTRGVNEACLTIRDMRLQLAKKELGKQQRALNSALLPEMIFSVAYWTKGNERSLAFKASGKPLDLRLESKFMFPMTAAQSSIELAVERFKKGTAAWKSTPTSTGAPRGTIFDTKRVTSLLVEADFAGAQVYMQGSARDNSLPTLAAAASQRQGATHGRQGQFAAEGALMHTTLTAPGIAFKMEYNTNEHRPTVNGELMIDASSNMLLPNVVPLILEVTNSIKEVMQSAKQTKEAAVARPSPPDTTATQTFFEEESIANADPARFFGKTKVDLGLRICQQEFGLTCQPIAKVDAKASLDDFYVTMNTIDSDEHGHFFAMSAVVTKLKLDVQHMYSKEPTFSFDMDSVVLSAMNNKHLSGTPGVSAILNVNPTRIVINGKQMQDLLLFREIWMPPEIRNAAAAAAASASTTTSSSSTSAGTAASPAKGDDLFVQRYQSVASAAAFPWNATVSITKLAVDLDLGQSIGRSSFTINNLWASQQKSSSWEQNLCVGLEEMAVHSTGRMSGFIQLATLGVRTSIKWPKGLAQTAARTSPLIQASIGVQKLMAKAAFDYQPFAFADIESFDFLMYNVHDVSGSADRLVAVVDCEKAYVFCTSNSPAQAVGLYQAFDRLILEKQAAHVQSMREIEKHIRCERTVVPARFAPQPPEAPNAPIEREKKTSITLHTDVVVTMGDLCFGIYPSTFFDSQMLKVEANNIQARFAVGLENGSLLSGLGMTLGQLQVALSSARKVSAVPRALDVSVEDVIDNALKAKGGTILRVPRVKASMQTWQPDPTNVNYIFKSLFDGKIDVGWNLSRINFIKGMWTSHSRALASRLGKSLPESAVKITAGHPNGDEAQEDRASTDMHHHEKITAEISLPQSRYEYHALEPPIIETPQLRDLGEATPSLHWIGLDKDRLPNLTHQIVIVSLLEVCKEVQDAYEKILGSS